jgi:hypothetical protein
MRPAAAHNIRRCCSSGFDFGRSWDEFPMQGARWQRNHVALHVKILTTNKEAEQSGAHQCVCEVLKVVLSTPRGQVPWSLPRYVYSPSCMHSLCSHLTSSYGQQREPPKSIPLVSPRRPPDVLSSGRRNLVQSRLRFLVFVRIWA